MGTFLVFKRKKAKQKNKEKKENKKERISIFFLKAQTKTHTKCEDENYDPPLYDRIQ